MAAMMRLKRPFHRGAAASREPIVYYENPEGTLSDVGMWDWISDDPIPILDVGEDAPEEDDEE
jgi:hypothetical protein